MSLNWYVSFDISRFEETDFSKEGFRHTVRRTLTDDPDTGTAQYVAVLAQRVYLDKLETKIYLDNEKVEAERKMNEFLLRHMVVTNPQYKRIFHLLLQNRTRAQQSHNKILQQIEKLQIVLETAISVALSYVSSPHEEEPNSSGYEEEPNSSDDDVFDVEAQRARLEGQRARLERRDAHLFGQYLDLVRDIPNKYDVQRW